MLKEGGKKQWFNKFLQGTHRLVYFKRNQSTPKCSFWCSNTFNVGLFNCSPTNILPPDAGAFVVVIMTEICFIKSIHPSITVRIFYKGLAVIYLFFIFGLFFQEHSQRSGRGGKFQPWHPNGHPRSNPQMTDKWSHVVFRRWAFKAKNEQISVKQVQWLVLKNLSVWNVSRTMQNLSSIFLNKIELWPFKTNFSGHLRIWIWI